MSRRAFAPKSLERYFLLLAVGVLLLVSVLTGILLFQNWKTYSSSSQARDSFAVIRATVKVVELASAERGPMNAALGANLPVPESSLAALRAARGKTDAQIDQLLALYAPPLRAEQTGERAEIQRIRDALGLARRNADLLIATPRGQLTSDGVWEVVSGMVRIIPQWQASMGRDVGLAMKNEVDAPSVLSLALLASELREQAGLLGSLFTPALASHRTLTQAEHFRIERVRGRIDELWTLINARIATRPGLAQSPTFMQMQRRYFDDGLLYLEHVRQDASRAATASNTSTGQLAATYVPLMGSIVQFRDVLLDAIGQSIHAHRADALRLLLITLGATALLVAALAMALVQFRRRVIRPFGLASRIISAIANGTPPAPIPAGRHQGEVEEVFTALRVLKENSAIKTRLEAERDRLIADLANLAETDYLTGLLNRRAFETRFEVTRAQWQEHGPVLAFILFDIDNFKNVNDTYGHASGDIALKSVAELCRKIWRQSDTVARVGGEEFAVLCHTPNAAEAVEMAERMRRAMSAEPIFAEDGALFTLTASFGVACAQWDQAADAGKLFHVADELLYQAKLSGRNQVMQRMLG
ncbi:GGDEF domain-containing protein [Achromobacter sp. Bel]|nr:GGDEF domain-containing protein [Achromobacter sp. Bel]